ncbi:hypothetical protein [Labrenzia sp. DG1229]|uniref:hypothetical protein n=1 Tax=Labrenzia sp. DG1229 TaxID=681847 RepID=UPI0004913F84|nr:hypothetical protein [Labrenzia sp. DG1229]
MKKFHGAILASVCLLSSLALAQEQQQVIIYKEAGTPPRVEAAGVDLLGAEKIHKMLGEDFIVFHDPGAAADGAVAMMAAPETKPVKPAPAPGTVPPVLPLCQCPEDYVVALEARIKTFDNEVFFAPRRVIVTPNQFEVLKNGAFPQIDFMRQNEMLMLQDQ